MEVCAALQAVGHVEEEAVVNDLEGVPIVVFQKFQKEKFVDRGKMHLVTLIMVKVQCINIILLFMIP